MSISYTSLEIIASQPVLAFQVPYDRFYRRMSLTHGLVSTKRISTAELPT